MTLHLPSLRLSSTALLPAALSLLLAVGGCSTKGEFTKEGKDLAQNRMDQLKASVQLQMAQQQFLAGDLEKARRSVETGLAAAPNSCAAHILKGRILMELGNLEAARGSFLTAESIDSTSAEAQYYLGLNFERFRQWQPAYEHYTRASESDRSNPQYVIAASEMLIHQKQYDQARTLLTEKRRDFNHNAAITQSLGDLAVLQGRYGDAVEFYQSARMLAPDDLAILEALARNQAQIGKFADAEFNIGILLAAAQRSTDPSGPTVKARVATSSTPNARTNPGAATMTVRDLQLLRARCLIGLQRFPEARQILLEQALAPEGQRDVGTWIQLGHACARLDDAPRLRQVAAKLLSIAPERHEGHTFRTIALLQQGDYAAAEQAIALAIKLANGDPAPYLVQSSLRLKQGQTAAALSSARSALELEPANPMAQRMVESLATATAAAATPDEPTK